MGDSSRTGDSSVEYDQPCFDGDVTLDRFQLPGRDEPGRSIVQPLTAGVTHLGEWTVAQVHSLQVLAPFFMSYSLRRKGSVQLTGEVPHLPQ
jgi:hypothetical protein